MGHELEFPFDITIIGEPGRFRNPALEGQLEGAPWVLTPPVYVAQHRDLLHLVNLEKSSALLGRPLLPGEIGCALAHEQARGQAQKDWILVLEDDADIQQGALEKLRSICSRLNSDEPTIVSLFDEANAQANSVSLKRLPYLPSSNTAYLASKTCPTLDGQQLVGTADWPVHLFRVRFFSFWGSGFKVVDSESLISASDSRPSLSPLARLLLLYSTNTGLSSSVKLRFWFSGLLRDVHRRIRLGEFSPL